MKKIGIVGLGIMGQGIATNFLKNGYEVFAWNRTKEVSNSLVESGGVACSNPKEVAEKVELLFEVTANDSSSQAVWQGEHGILAGASKQTICVASSTLSIDWVDQLAGECAKKGITFCDMPMTGGRVGAETGNLTLLCGGDKKVVDGLEPSLKAIAAKVLYFGPVGSGMRYKLILNFLQALHIIGFGQAMNIAKSHNMDLEMVAQSLADRPGGVITGIAQKAYFQEPDPTTFSIDWITKDLQYAKVMAKNLDIPLLENILSIYQDAQGKGYGKKDWASVNTLVSASRAHESE